MIYVTYLRGKRFNSKKYVFRKKQETVFEHNQTKFMDKKSNARTADSSVFFFISGCEP